MTSEEMQRAIEFILQQQAVLVEQQARTDMEIREMRVQADADRKEVRDAIKTLVEQAAEDRAAVIEANAEIKEHINILLTVIETTNRVAVSSEKRLTLLESRVDKIENSQTQ